MQLAADRATLHADGTDLAFVTVTVADKDGRTVPRASDRVTFSLSGPGDIVATDNGILHKMRMAAPGKHFIEAPTAGNSATCKSCAHCPWMAMNGLQNLAEVLEAGAASPNQIHVDPELGKQAKRAIDRMLDFAAAKKAKALPSGSLEQEAGLFSGVGPA